MTEENTVDNETNGEIENSHQLLPSLKMVLETSTNSTIERNIYQVLRKHFLEQRPITWKPIKVELVVNTELTDDFFSIRKKFEKSSNGNRLEFEEHYGFLIENDAQISDICNNGYQCIETSFNVLGHSKGGVYVCKYADVCIRQASVRRTWEGNVPIKLMIFKIVEGKQTAALVRKGPKLQPIAPTTLFTSHCSVITPKETDDLDKQFDQSQIFLYEFEGRGTVKRPHHCLPYAVVSFIQDGTLWPANFQDLDAEPDILETDTLRVIAQSDDPLLQNKLKENVELAEAATRALEHIYEEEPPPPPPPVVEQPLSPSSNSEAISTTTKSDNTSVSVVNGTGASSPPTMYNDTISATSPAPAVVSINNIDASLNSTIPPPPPPPSSSTATTTTIPTAKTPNSTVAATIPLTHSAAAVQAAYRQQTGLLGALPAAAALRGVPGGVYATTAGFANGLTGQILYGGVPLDAFRNYQTTTNAAAQYVFATHAGQNIQQSALYAAQLQAAQQQAAQYAAATQQQQQQQQQTLINGIPPGCMLVRTSNGGYALLAQSPTAAAAAQQQAQTQLAQQQYFSFNAAGQPTANAARLPVAMVGGQPQQVVYQYAGQPTIQAGPTQYIQLPSNYAQQQQQQQQQLSTSPIMQTATSAASQAYTNQTPTQYIGAPQLANNNNANNSSSSLIPSSTVVTSSSAIQPQPTSTLISPQKQSAASATAAALQQQQQYQHTQYSQQQQQATNSAHGTTAYYAAIAQAQAQLSAQVQAQQQAASFAQQQQFNYIPQMQYTTQQGVPQQMYYATSGGQTIYQAGGQSYILAQAAPTAGTTTTGAPAMYSAGPALHNGAAQQQNQQHSSQSQQQQQQIAYQIATATGQSATAYQLFNAASNANIATQQQTTAGPGVVAQQPAQLVQRPSVIAQARHHPYRS